MVKPVLFDVSYPYLGYIGDPFMYNLHIIGDDGYLYYSYVTGDSIGGVDSMNLKQVLDLRFTNMDFNKIHLASLYVTTQPDYTISMYLTIPVINNGGYKLYIIEGTTSGVYTVKHEVTINNTITTICPTSNIWLFTGGKDGLDMIIPDSGVLKSIKFNGNARVLNIVAALYPIVIVGTYTGLIISEDGFVTDNYKSFIGGDTTNKLLSGGVGKIIMATTDSSVDPTIIQLYMLQETGVSSLRLKVNKTQHTIEYIWGEALINSDSQLKDYKYSLDTPDTADWSAEFYSYPDLYTAATIYLLNTNNCLYRYQIYYSNNEVWIEITTPDPYYNNDFSNAAKSQVRILQNNTCREFVLSPDKRLSYYPDDNFESSTWHEIKIPEVS